MAEQILQKKRLLTLIIWLYKQFKVKHRKEKKKEFNELWNNFKWPKNICSWRPNKEKSGIQKNCLKNNRNFLHLITLINLQIQDDQ